MKEKFVSKNFRADAVEMIGRINAILDDYEADGYDLSLRQLYYQLVSRNLVPNTERSYKNVGQLVSDARLAGLIDWDMIKDRGREMLKNAHWLNPRDFVESCAPQFKIDHWKYQDCYVEVMVEKQALEGVLEPVCRELDVPFTANKGYSSSSAMYEAGKRMGEHLKEEREVIVIYLGDHDPSGIDMSRDVEDRLRLFAECDTINFSQKNPVTIKVQRIALNMDQIRVLRPPENPAKLTDSRADEYIKKFGRSSWELDAIEPKQLADLVRKAVTKLMNVDSFYASKAVQEKGREQLIASAKKFK